MSKVQITSPAKMDIQESFDWWSDHRSLGQATEWYERIFHAIATLERMPERCPLVPEKALSQSGVRQLLFGIGKRPTHRIVFHYAGDTDTVTILRVRRHSQVSL